jgi:hypothetical protein
VIDPLPEREPRTTVWTDSREVKKIPALPAIYAVAKHR